MPTKEEPKKLIGPIKIKVNKLSLPNATGNKFDFAKTLEVGILLFSVLAATCIGVTQNKINEKLVSITEKQLSISERQLLIEQNDKEIELYTLTRPLIKTEYDSKNNILTIKNYGKLPIWIDTFGFEKVTSSMSFRTIENDRLIGNQAHRILPSNESVDIDFTKIIAVFSDLIKEDDHLVDQFIFQIFFSIDNLHSGKIYLARMFFMPVPDKSGLLGIKLTPTLSDVAIWPLDGKKAFQEVYKEFEKEKSQ